MLHGTYGVSNHWQWYCLFNSLFKLTAEQKKYQRSALPALCEREPSPHKWPVMLKAVFKVYLVPGERLFDERVYIYENRQLF